MKADRKAARKFFETVVLAYESDDCLLWPFDTDAYGYPRLGLGGGRYRVNRLVCEAKFGPAPSPKHEAAHGCGVRACVNHRHLRWDSRTGNQADRVVHGTHNRGERQGRSKLTPEDVSYILANCHQTKNRVLAYRFGVSPSTICHIKKGRTWAYEEGSNNA